MRAKTKKLRLCFLNPRNPSEKGGSSQLKRRGFHCERGMKIETFLCNHPIRAVIQDQNFQFVDEEVKGYLSSIVREFYSNLREDLNVDFLLETIISGKQLMAILDLIARSVHYDHPATHNKPYPLRAITEFDANLFANTMCKTPTLLNVIIVVIELI